MLRGILISLLASLLFGYMYYFSTLLKPLSGTDIFGYRMIFTFPFVVLSVFMFKQKNALIHRLKLIKKQPHLKKCGQIERCFMYVDQDYPIPH